MSLATVHDETSGRDSSCARHLMNSVGEDIVQLASPPAAPASQILDRGTPSGLVGSVTDLSKAIKDRLYATKRRALSAPYPKMGAAAPNQGQYSSGNAGTRRDVQPRTSALVLSQDRGATPDA